MRVFVVAFQESSPLAAAQLGVWSYQMTVWLMTWAVAVLLWRRESPSRSVVPNPPVTVMYSSSILIENELVGKPVAEATLIVVCEA